MNITVGAELTKAEHSGHFVASGRFRTPALPSRHDSHPLARWMSMRQLTCDVAVIGAGTAGLGARSAAARAGARTLLIEAGPGGTTCARVGCMPSKLLICAANAAAATRRLGLFGLALEGGLRVDGPAVLARVRHQRDAFVGSVLDEAARIPAAERIAGRARFAGPTTLLVDDGTRIEARAIVLATGSRPVVPPALDGLDAFVLTNDTVFELPDLPRSLAVVGAGPLGIELALAFARLGVRVGVFDKEASLGGLSDPEVLAAARAILGRELDLKLGTTFEAERAGDGVALHWRAEDGASGTDTFERVLAAAGRKPDLGELALDRAGLALDRRGVPVFDRATLRCGESPVFLAGDVDADRPILHEATFEGAIAGRNAAAYPAVTPQERAVAMSIVFTDPEIAAVGARWSALEEEGAAVVVGAADFSASGRAVMEGTNAGLLRLYADRRDGVVLGAEMIAPQGEHLAHLLSLAVARRATVDDLLALPLYHPTVEESLKTALRAIREARDERA